MTLAMPLATEPILILDKEALKQAYAPKKRMKHPYQIAIGN